VAIGEAGEDGPVIAKRPSRNARVVGRPRVTSTIVFLFVSAIGAAVAADGRVGAVLFGGFMLAVGLFCLVATMRTRLWEALGPFIGPFDRAANEALKQRVAKYR
jgi:hypothetical protein